MASADYKLCNVCSRKVFYDANIAYDDEYCQDVDSLRIVAICRDCAETHEIKIIRKETKCVSAEAMAEQWGNCKPFDSN